MEAAKDDFIFTCIGNDNDLREVTLSDKGLLNLQRKDLYTLIILLLQLISLVNYIKKLNPKVLIF